MMMGNEREQASNRDVAGLRWGGALLALGGLVYAIAIVVYVVGYGQPAGSGVDGAVLMADRMAHYLDRQAIAHGAWFMEMGAALSMTVAGFVLQQADPPRAAFVPPRVAWALVAVGALVLAMMYPLMLGALPVAAEAGDAQLFGVFNTTAVYLFYTGNLVNGLGLAGAFLLAAGRTLPRWLGFAGLLVYLVLTLAALGLLAGFTALSMVAPLGLLGSLLVAWLGFSIWRKAG